MSWWTPLATAVLEKENATGAGATGFMADSDGTVETYNTLASPFVLSTGQSRISDSGNPKTPTGGGLTEAKEELSIQQLIIYGLVAIVGITLIRTLKT